MCADCMDSRGLPPPCAEQLEPRLLLSGTSYLVTSLGDVVASDGVVTLREAIEAANTNSAVTDDVWAGNAAEMDIIAFDQAALSAEAGVAVGDPLTITLGGTQLEITDDLEITGLGADVLAVDAASGSRVLLISGGETDVALAGLAITGGLAKNGAGIHNYGNTLTLINSLVHNNSSIGSINYGGGIYNQSGTLILINSGVYGNLASGSIARGGGIYSSSTLTLTNSMVVGNSTMGSIAFGGGIYNRSKLTLTNSTIVGNYAEDNGGGIYHSYGTLTLNNTIVALNEAADSADVSGSFVNNNNLIGVGPGFVRNPSSGADGLWSTADDDYGDLHLTDTSIAINLGDNALAVDGEGLPLVTDMDGDPRMSDDQVDIGAYEYQGTPSPLRDAPSTLVTTLVDAMDTTDGQISLHEALVYSSVMAPDLTFSPGLAGGTIVLNGSELSIARSMTIDASSIGGITIDAGKQSRVMSVVASAEVSLAGLTLIGGLTEDDGGGIYNTGTLTLTSVTVSGCRTIRGTGGGIYNTGSLTLFGSTVSGNSATNGDSDGGGIYSTGLLSLANSVISDNMADNNGGGIYNAGVTAFLITGSTVTGNSGGGNGGGIYDAAAPTITLINSTISGNSATGEYRDGGGIYNVQSVLSLTNCLVYDNSAGRSGGAIYSAGDVEMVNSTMSDNWVNTGLGGGIYSDSAMLMLTNSTVAGNRADAGSGGGIYCHDSTLTVMNSTVRDNSAILGGGIFSDLGTTIVTNSVVSGNSAYWGGGIFNYGMQTMTNSTVSGNWASIAGGGIYDDASLTLSNSIVVFNDAMIGPDIAGSGSPTNNSSMVGGEPGFVRNPSAGADGVWGTADDDHGDLHLLVTGAAVDAGDNTLAVDGDGLPLTTDLDGKPRIYGATVDIGAYEYAKPGDADYDGDVDLDDFSALKANFGSGTTLAQGDFDLDGDVDLDDFSILKTNFGTGIASASTIATAPEVEAASQAASVQPAYEMASTGVVKAAGANVSQSSAALPAASVVASSADGKITRNVGRWASEVQTEANPISALYSVMWADADEAPLAPQGIFAPDGIFDILDLPKLKVTL